MHGLMQVCHVESPDQTRCKSRRTKPSDVEVQRAPRPPDFSQKDERWLPRGNSPMLHIIIDRSRRAASTTILQLSKLLRLPRL
jgi:hypothetical protein